MNKIYLIFLVFLLIFTLTFSQCKSKQKNINNNHSIENIEMMDKHLISINVTTTQSYCGGAAPSDIMITELQTPKKLANVTIYIKEGENNDWSKPIVAEHVSDENGVVKVELKDGDYCVVFANKSHKNEYNKLLEQYGEKSMYRDAIDKECLLNFMLQPEVVFTVTNGKTGMPIIINQHKPCDWNSVPCAAYHGPLPPSSPPRGK